MANCGVLAPEVVGKCPSCSLRPVQFLAKMVLGDHILVSFEPKTTHIYYLQFKSRGFGVLGFWGFGEIALPTPPTTPETVVNNAVCV